MTRISDADAVSNVSKSDFYMLIALARQPRYRQQLIHDIQHLSDGELSAPGRGLIR